MIIYLSSNTILIVYTDADGHVRMRRQYYNMPPPPPPVQQDPASFADEGIAEDAGEEDNFSDTDLNDVPEFQPNNPAFNHGPPGLPPHPHHHGHHGHGHHGHHGHHGNHGQPGGAQGQAPPQQGQQRRRRRRRIDAFMHPMLPFKQ